MVLEKGEVDALLIGMWASYPPRWYDRVGERSTRAELAALGATNNANFPDFKIKPKGAAEINLGPLTPAEDVLLQRIAWETVSKYPYAGVAADK